MNFGVCHRKWVMVAEKYGESGKDGDENERYSGDSELVGVGMSNWIRGLR